MSIQQVEVCPVCGNGEDLGRQCEVCQKHMHHFCSHDVCRSLNIVENGVLLKEFRDVCYCSKECFLKTKISQQESSSSSLSDIEEESHSFFDSDSDLEMSSSVQTTSVGATPAPISLSSTTQAPSTAATTSSTGPIVPNFAPTPTPTTMTINPAASTTPSTTSTSTTTPETPSPKSFLKKNVSFTPARERWMKPKSLYKNVGITYLQGVTVDMRPATINNKETFEYLVSDFVILSWSNNS